MGPEDRLGASAIFQLEGALVSKGRKKIISDVDHSLGLISHRWSLIMSRLNRYNSERHTV